MGFSRQEYWRGWPFLSPVDLEMAEEPEIKLPTSLDHQKNKRVPEKHLLLLFWLPNPLTLWITTNCRKFLKRWEYKTTLPASWEIYAGQEETVRTGQGTTDWFQIGKGACQGCIFNVYAAYIMRDAGLDEAQAGIKMDGKHINNLRYADDTIFMAKSE